MGGDADSNSDDRRLEDVNRFLAEYCRFGGDRTYVLMAVARTKENDHLANAEQVSYREIAADQGDIPRTVRALSALARQHRDGDDQPLTFRLYVTVNARDALIAYFNFRARTDEWVRRRIRGDDGVAGKFKRVDEAWRSELHRDASRDEKRFLIDFDGEWDVDSFEKTLSERTTVLVRRETPNGHHLVTEPFNYTELAMFDREGIELKTDGMLFLTFLP